MPYSLRKFEAADFQTLWRIDQDCFPPGIAYSRAELKLYIRRRNAFTLVATEVAMGASSDGSQRGPSSPVDDAIVGFIVSEAEILKQVEHSKKQILTGHIITIDVKFAARRAGIGSLLLNAAEAKLRAMACEMVTLETAVDNVSALSFYKRHGYSVVGTYPRYYSNGVDALVLEKPLARGEMRPTI